MIGLLILRFQEINEEEKKHSLVNVDGMMDVSYIYSRKQRISNEIFVHVSLAS